MTVTPPYSRNKKQARGSNGYSCLTVTTRQAFRDWDADYFVFMLEIVFSFDLIVSFTHGCQYSSQGSVFTFLSGRLHSLRSLLWILRIKVWHFTPPCKTTPEGRLYEVKDEAEDMQGARPPKNFA